MARRRRTRRRTTFVALGDPFPGLKRLFYTDEEKTMLTMMDVITLVLFEISFMPFLRTIDGGWMNSPKLDNQ